MEAGIAGRAAGASARTLGEHYVRRRLRVAAVLTLAGAIAVAAGFTGFGILAARSDELDAHGVRTKATVTATRHYKGRLRPDRYSPSITVAYAGPEGARRSARIWIGEGDRFAVGQRVDIVYDPRDPERVQLPGDVNTGPVGLALIFAIIFGAVSGGLGLHRVRLCRAAGRALRGPSRRMLATSRTWRYRRQTERSITLVARGVPTIDFRALRPKDWRPSSEPVDADVFGGQRPRAAIVVVGAAPRAVAVGRTPR